MILTVIGIVAVVVLSDRITKADLVMDAVRAENIIDCGHGESFSYDGLRLYMAPGGGYGSRDIWVVERESLDAPWGEAVNLGPNINTEHMEGWPAISPNDLELYFGRDDGTNWYAMRSTRASKDDPWGPATEYTGVFPDDFSSDGLTKYSHWSGGYGGYDIWATTRATRDDDWGEAVNLGPNVNNSNNQYNPSISGDGLALFFKERPPNRLKMSVRVTKNDPWGPAVDFGSPVNGSWWIGWPEVSPDGSTLYCNRGAGLGSTKVSIKPFVDFTEDGMVDIDDLSAMMEYWGTDHSFYDIAPMAWGDGVVDDADLEVLMSYYGQAVDYTGNTVIDVKPPHNPQPANGWTIDIENVEKALPLSWMSIDQSPVHDLYLGTDRSAVENANITDTSGVYRGELSGNSYMPPEGVQVGQTYYWRLDEVRSEDIAKKGEIWSFTVADYLIVDDFENYTNNTNAAETVFHTWTDGLGYLDPAPGYSGNGTGAVIGHWPPPIAEQTIVHGGHQSLPFYYDNDGTVWEGSDFETSGLAYYAETQRTWEEPQDWTRRGVKTLALWFHGDPNNYVEPMYVSLEDSSGKSDDVMYTDSLAITAAEWQQWSINMSDFVGVDLTAIKKMSIRVGDKESTEPGGSGIIYIDDIQLHRPLQQ
jgi:hypothetical protein